MIHVIGTGLSGLVGTRVMHLLSDWCTFEDISKETGGDILDFEDVRKKIVDSNASWIFHFAAYTNVQAAEEEKEKKEESISWKVNVAATKNIVDIARETGKHVLYISTDYVFDGMKDAYDETDTPSPRGWYATTKFEGERLVSSLKDCALILRISNPYRSFPVGKLDFVHKIMDRLEKNEKVSGATDSLFTPTYIDDIALAIRALIDAGQQGIFHVPAKDVVSPYQAAQIIARAIGKDPNIIEQTTFEAYMKGKAPIPQKGVLVHKKIDPYVHLHTFEEGVRMVIEQERKTI